MLITNNEDTLEHALDSISEVPAHLLIAALDTTDKGVEICRQYGADVVRVTGHNRSEIRNNLLGTCQTPWSFWLEPWEFIIEGQEALKTLPEKPAAFRVKIFDKDVVSKQTRLWANDLKLKYINPVCETLTDADASPLGISLWASPYKDETVVGLLENWHRQHPNDLDPIYYLACLRFGQGNYKEFLALADNYIFRQPKITLSSTMLRYYSGMANCYITKNLTQSLQQAIHCLARHPLMAEFWCLLGDTHIQAHEFDKAIAFYENALILGKKRLQEDAWPIHLSKYKTYPETMIKKCRTFLDNRKVLITPGQAH